MIVLVYRGGQSWGRTVVSLFFSICACDGVSVCIAHPLYGGDVDGVGRGGVEDVRQVKHLAVAAGDPEVPLSVLPEVLRLLAKTQQSPRKAEQQFLAVFK